MRDSRAIRRAIPLLPLAVATSLLVRILVGRQHNLNIDEGVTYYISLLSVPDKVRFVTYTDRHPPLYYILLGFVSPLSSSELALRLPSIVCAVATTVLIFSITARLTGRTATAATAAFLQALSFGYWELDTQARMFSLSLLGALIATWACARMLLDGDRRMSTAAVWMLGFVVSAYSYYLGVLTLVSHAAAYLALGKRRQLPWGLFAAASILILPLMWLMHGQLGRGNAEGLNLRNSLWQLVAVIPSVIGILPLLRELVPFDTGAPWVFVTFTLIDVAVLGWCGLALRRLAREKRDEAAFLLMMFLGNVLPLLFACLIANRLNFRERYLVLAFPYLTMAMAIALQQISRRNLRVLSVGLLCLLNVADVVLWISLDHPKELNMHDLAANLRRYGSADDVLLIYLPTNYICPFNYYYARDDLRLRRYGDEVRLGAPSGTAYRQHGGMPQQYIASADGVRQELRRLLSRRRIWLLINRVECVGFSSHEAIRAVLSAPTDTERVFETHQGHTVADEDTFYLYELKPRNGTASHAEPAPP